MHTHFDPDFRLLLTSSDFFLLLLSNVRLGFCMRCMQKKMMKK